MRWRKSLNTKCAFVNSPASLQSNHAHPNRCVSTASRPLLTTHAEHWKLNASASASSVKPSVSARLGNAWRQSAVSIPVGCYWQPNCIECTVCSVAAIKCLRAVAHLKNRGTQVFESWKKPKTASALLIRWSPVRIWHDLPTSLRFGQSAAARRRYQHSAARYSGIATIAMLERCCLRLQ